KFSRPDQRVAERAGHILEKILGEKGAVNLDTQSVFQFGDLDALLGLAGGVRFRSPKQRSAPRQKHRDTGKSNAAGEHHIESETQTREGQQKIAFYKAIPLLWEAIRRR